MPIKDDSCRNGKGGAHLPGELHQPLVKAEVPEHMSSV